MKYLNILFCVECNTYFLKKYFFYKTIFHDYAESLIALGLLLFKVCFKDN